MAEAWVAPAEGGGGWMGAAEGAGYLGIGRFVLGLYHDIEVLGNPDFVAYIYNKVKGMVEKVGQ